MKKTFLACLLLALAFLFSCKKPAGSGGNASIKGKVWVEDWDKYFTAINYEYPGSDEDVYIIYGEDTSYGDRIKTNYNGEFEFKYLRKGKYRVYVYSSQAQTATDPSAQQAKVIEVEITKNKEVKDIGTITVKR
ncbi:MAG: hypothetical protein ACJ76F_02545 [Bacteroidia bacterium]